MAPSAATSPGNRLQRLTRRLAAGALLPVVVVVGLLAMHALTAPGAPPPTIGAAATVSGDTTRQPAHAHQVADAANTVAGVDCEGCGAPGHVSAAMACMLALLLTLLILKPPALAPRWMHPTMMRSEAVNQPASATLPRPPSLHVLCISRT